MPPFVNSTTHTNHQKIAALTLALRLLSLKLLLHNGLSRTVKIFRKIVLWVSMARLTSNLVNASQNKWKKWKKDFEIGEIWTPDQP